MTAEREEKLSKAFLWGVIWISVICIIAVTFVLPRMRQGDTEVAHKDRVHKIIRKFKQDPFPFSA